MIQFKNHTIYIKPSYGYCILSIKKRAYIDPEAMQSIITTNRHFINKGFYRFLLEINIGVKTSVQAVDLLNINGNARKLEKLAIVDYELTTFSRFLINCFTKILYLKGSVKIKTFKTKRKAGLWLKE